MTTSTTPSKGPEHPSSPFSSPTTPPSADVKIKAILDWLVLVEYNARSATPEILDTMAELSNSTPTPGDNPSMLESVIERVKKVASSRCFDPDLSTKAEEAMKFYSSQLSSPMRISSPSRTGLQATTTTARKLF